MPDDDRHVMAWLRINRALARAIRKKSLDSAKAANLAQRCVKVTNAPDGRFVRPTGERTHVERLPFCRWWITGGGSGSSNVWEYSCPVAISLLLRFLLECCMVLLLMLCVSIPQMLSNITRSQVRDHAFCRAAARHIVRGSDWDTNHHTTTFCPSPCVCIMHLRRIWVLASTSGQCGSAEDCLPFQSLHNTHTRTHSRNRRSDTDRQARMLGAPDSRALTEISLNTRSHAHT